MSDEHCALRPRYGPWENAGLPPSTSINDGTTVHQPDTNYIRPDHGPNYAVYGYHRYDTYHDNLWFGLEGPPLIANLERQHAHQTNPDLNIGYPTPENAQHMHVPPGPPHIEHKIRPAHDIPNAVVRDHSPPMPDVTDTSSSVSESAPSGMPETPRRSLP